MKEKVRTIITTDMECDDMNSMIHLCLHLNEMDLAGIVYTSSRYHFNGDGVHTLGEVTPHYSCSGKAAYEKKRKKPGPDPEAVSLTEYRPFEEGWIERLFENEYAAVLPYLRKHDPSYPSAEYLLSIIRYGNTAFEGDVREATEGSDYIKDIILDDDPRLLYIQSWGGINTVVRALLSIEAEYKETGQWGAVYRKVCDKVRILGVISGVGQDNSWKDHAAKMWKDIVMLRTQFGYGGFFAAKTTQEDSVHTYRAPWLKENIKFGHGPLMGKTILMGDGTYIKGEPDNRQFGQITYIDWNMESMPRVDLDQYDWLGEGDSGCWVPLLPNGLRGLEDGRYGTVCGLVFRDEETSRDMFAGILEKKENNPFLYAFQKEWAARADWCVKEYDECAHPPVVSANEAEITASPGETVRLEGSAEASDHSGVSADWFVYGSGSRYAGAMPEPVKQTEDAWLFTVPEDAQDGDLFILCFRAETLRQPSMTRYAETMIRVRAE